MATFIHPSGKQKIKIPPMTVAEARKRGALPNQYVPVIKNDDGFNEQLGEQDDLVGDILLVPKNRAGGFGLSNFGAIRNEADSLSLRGFDVEFSNDLSWVCIRHIDLPGSFGEWTDESGNVVWDTSALIDIPVDYPMSPPGVGANHPSRAIHLPLIRYRGKLMNDFYRCKHITLYRQAGWI